MDDYMQGLWLVRLVFQRGLAGIYFLAFLAALHQFPALLGEQGLLPASEFVKRVPFLAAPSVFHWRSSDRFAKVVAWVGIALSLFALSGASERGPIVLSAATWLVLWFLYLSLVNVGQAFYAFGWESMLVEAGFFAAFLGPTGSAPSGIPILVLRWMLFRTELGAGLIKLRSDPCWRDLTCLFYHHETQPLPNPLSRHFHFMPKFLLKGGVLFSHFVQLVAPFGLFAPQPIAAVAGGLILSHQLLLIVSGNYAWLNWLTVVLGVTAFSDRILGAVLPIRVPALLPRSAFQDGVLYALAGAVIVLSIRPALNLISRHQRMNYNYNPLHLVNAYGAFGSVTKVRYEVILEGTKEPVLTDDTKWREYELKAKPGPVLRRPPQVAPYHLRLDWLMWFLPFSVEVSGQESGNQSVHESAHKSVQEPGRGVEVPGYERWFVRLVQKLLQGHPPILKLFRRNPFPDQPPRFVRARFYRYRFANREEQKQTGAYWVRSLVGEYLPPIGGQLHGALEP